MHIMLACTGAETQYSPAVLAQAIGSGAMKGMETSPHPTTTTQVKRRSITILQYFHTMSTTIGNMGLVC